MRMRNLSGKSVDRIGRKMLKAIRVPDKKIDAIVASETLFDPVREAVHAQLPQDAPAPFLVLIKACVRRWQVVLPAAAAVFLIAGLALYVTREKSAVPQVGENIHQQDLPTESLPVPTEKFDDSVASCCPVTISERKSLTRRPMTPVRHVVQQPRYPEVEQVSEFHAFPYVGGVSQINGESQIVRVELPRSSLFAMGIDLPVENQATTKVKADLLIGEDGSLRAVRIVNQ
jgi:hypothetical protein